MSIQTGLYFNRNKNTINVGFDTKEKGLKILKGKVVDQNGEAVIGASIQVKGTTAGVITDINGNYELTNVPINAQIAISYIGYQTIILNANSKKLALVTLREDTELLDEVVVVGYGTMKKKDLLGATSMVSGDQLATNSSISVGGALQGKMSGINILSSSGFPGAETSISIRGVGTFGNGDASPLVVILSDDFVRYYFENGYAKTGWQYIDGYKFYFDSCGRLVQDVQPDWQAVRLSPEGK